jgi:hypothetical protein
MAKQRAFKADSSTSRKSPWSYKVAGKLADGVVILKPKSKPKHFTVKQIRETIQRIRRDGEPRLGEAKVRRG